MKSVRCGEKGGGKAFCVALGALQPDLRGRGRGLRGAHGAAAHRLPHQVEGPGFARHSALEHRGRPRLGRGLWATGRGPRAPRGARERHGRGGSTDLEAPPCQHASWGA